MKKTRRRLLIISPFLFLFFVWFYVKMSYNKSFNTGTLSKTQNINAENNLLETELKSASKPAVYLLLDLADKKIYLKIKGIILKEFKVSELEITGNQPIGRSYNLTGREEKQTPKRIEIKPEQEKDKSNTAPAPAVPPTPSPADSTFDIEDMPSEYTLLLNNDLSIAVSSQVVKDNSIKSFASYLLNSKNRIKNLFSIMQSRIKKQKFIKIAIGMEKGDANSLYWSLPDGAEVLVKN